jgi:Mg2+/Co2+ transporter CorB
MRKAIGLLIILWALSQFFSSSVIALDSAARESFHTLEAAAIKSQKLLE